jgi:hypothetical protein
LYSKKPNMAKSFKLVFTYLCSQIVVVRTTNLIHF